MIAIDISKQQAVDVDPSSVQQINFAANLDCAEGTRKAKETVSEFSQGTVKLL